MSVSGDATDSVEVEKARMDIVAAARDMLDGALSFIEGARRIAYLQLYVDVAELDENIIPFVAIDSETDVYPMGAVRLLWTPDALAKLQDEIDRSEQWAREIGYSHCHKLIERFEVVDRGGTIDEAEFWLRLRQRINAALRAWRDSNVRVLWVGDFVPDALLPQLERGVVLVWVLVSENDGRSFIEYRLCLHLSESAVEKYRNGQWRELLPKPGATGWLAVDRASKEIDALCD